MMLCRPLARLHSGTRRLIRVIELTEAADPADVGLALLARRETAISDLVAGVVERAPRVVLRFGARADRSRRDDNREHKMDRRYPFTLLRFHAGTFVRG